MVRLFYLVTLATLVCFHFIRAENNSVEVKAPENKVVILSGNDQLEDSVHQRFARQATTKRVTTKKGSTKKANIVAVI